MKTQRQQIVKRKFQTAVGMIVLTLTSTSGVAVTKNVGGMADNLVLQTGAIKTFILSAAGIAGLILAIGGIITLTKDSRQKQPGDNKKGMVMIIGGVSLIGIATVVLIAQQSILGQTDTATFSNSGGF